ncbi:MULTISPECIES: FtsX-like permease family protein [Streptomyces]|uniref:ABC transporter permease n=1 Tax=Streptomyces glycanivorans TaxID=3033808 RepID=A0ABY9JG25_9ACTN|nr:MULTISPECIES: FtsX-like permease family protein [unclassified Streptomyces]WSQ80128.1 FtsX-like permease family protein [Streptomyces sp. NBC_01213]WLQ66711.1 ABC transporter permease [Streptomyces sp. Alt3]WSQ87460.1 FtsX-like permease family protein [Streptomyces sp. NBC_01212]WSR06530.1 FtsX-like permease family protein [Streptomyces sp. NBC_01208]WSR50808.1 FtsX-like permease family protein [Streptomyces sp. NBC_01201]
MIRLIRRLVRLVVPYRKDLSLAWSTIKGRKGGFIGSFVAIAAGSAVITACGILLMSGLNTGVVPERYSGTAVAIGGEQSYWLDESAEVRYSERVTLPAEKVDAVAAVPGVKSAVGDVDIDVSVLNQDGEETGGPDGFPVFGHGWSGASLGPFPLREGSAPSASDEVVPDADLARRADLSVGSKVRIVVGSIPSTYRVVGIAGPPKGGLDRQSAVFFTDDRATELSGRPGRVDAIGVRAEPGVTPGALADRITAAVPHVVARTGTERGDVEFLDVGDARSLVVESSASFGGTMVLIVVFVVATTLGLSVQQRRRELALLRAIGATPKQIHWMIGAEMTLVSSAGALVGAIPGIALAFVMRGVFIFADAMPPDFRMEVGWLPFLASLVLCMVSARLGGWLVARRVARTSPVEALGDAAIEPKKLGWIRLTIGFLLIPLGLLLTVSDVAVSGDSVADTAAAAVLLFVVALGCVGPLLLRGAILLFGSVLNRQSKAPGFLAHANARAGVRRLSTAATPLAMGVTLAAVQVFGASTTTAASQEQFEAGLRADRVLTASSGAGVSPQAVDAVRGAPGVAVVTPVARMRVLLTFPSEDSTATKVFAAQGVAPERLSDTMDLEVIEGDIAKLKDGTVALSRVVAETVRAHRGETVDLRLGDGTVTKPRVVAIYERGLGFGDVTLPNELVVAHTTSQVNSAVLIRAEDGTDAKTLEGALRNAVERYPTVEVGDREAFRNAPGSGSSGDWALNLLFQTLLLGYIAIAVVNTLVMATAARVREFAMLQLIGASREQVRAMMNGEARIVIFSALLFGLLATIPPLVGISDSLAKSPVPSISPFGLIAIVALTVALSWGSIAMATKYAMRPAPVDAIGGRE